MCFPDREPRLFSDDEFSRLLKEDPTQGEQLIGVESFTGNFPAHYRTGCGAYRHHQDPAQWIPHRYSRLGCVSCPGGMGSFADEKQELFDESFFEPDNFFEMIAPATQKVGIIGAGVIGDFHAEALKAMPGAELVAAYARKEDKANAFAQQHGCVGIPIWISFSPMRR